MVQSKLWYKVLSLRDGTLIGESSGMLNFLIQYLLECITE